MTAPLHPRGNADTCIKCKKKFVAGDRIQIVHIVLGTGRNPSNPVEWGANISSEFELAHAVCVDPQLSSDIIMVTS
jgi:hypothetical protein